MTFRVPGTSATFKVLALYVAAGLAILGVACLLSRGSGGGDEALAMAMADGARLHGLAWLLEADQAQWVAHRLFWIMEKVLYGGLLAFLLPDFFDKNEILHSSLLVLDGSLFMLGAAGLAWRHLSRRHAPAIALMAVSAFFCASSVASFFTGGSIECQMCLYACVMMVQLDRPGRLLPHQILLLLLAAGFLVFCKSYALAFVLPVAMLLEDRRQRAFYAGTLVLLALSWLALSVMVGGHGVGGTVDFYETFVSLSGLQTIMLRFGAAFVSAPFGLVWCVPLLFLAVLAPGSWRVRRIKAAAMLLLLGFFSLFDFWHGAGAVAGPRYVIPFLILFLPEMAQGLESLRLRRPRLLPAIPLLAAFFLPTLDYRNSLIYRDTESPGGNAAWATADPAMHPAVYAWRVVLSRALDAPSFRPSPDLPVVLAMDTIMPMTGISRAVYVLESDGRNGNPRLQVVHRWLDRAGLDHAWFWQLLRIMLAVLLLAPLLAAALWPSALRPARRAEG